MDFPVLLPSEALQRSDSNFYLALYWRNAAIIDGIKSFLKRNAAGELCSLRFTASRPKKEAAANEESFLFDRLLPILDAACFITDSLPEELYINRADNSNSLFALASFPGEIVVEIELNECLPNSVPAIAFCKANYTHGHKSNQPLVGFFNEDGLLLADDDGMELLVTETNTARAAHGAFDWMQMRFEVKLKAGQIRPGRENLDVLAKMIREAAK